MALYGVFLLALLALGTWQMKRAAQKIDILTAAEQSLNTEAVAPQQLGDLAEAANAYTLVTFSGNYDSTRQFLWDNRVHKGQAGYEVITPVKTEAGIVLVNRGWVAQGRTREDVPDIVTNITDISASSDFKHTGLFSRPSKGLMSGDSLSMINNLKSENGQSESWPRLLQYFDYQAIEAALGEPVLAGLIQPQQVQPQQAQPQQKVQPQQAQGQMQPSAPSNMSQVKNAALYTANWEPAAAIGPTRHYGYAFQWYAMAVALSILYIVYNTKRIEPV